MAWNVNNLRSFFLRADEIWLRWNLSNMRALCVCETQNRGEIDEILWRRKTRSSFIALSVAEWTWKVLKFCHVVSSSLLPLIDQFERIFDIPNKKGSISFDSSELSSFACHLCLVFSATPSFCRCFIGGRFRYHSREIVIVIVVQNFSWNYIKWFVLLVQLFSSHDSHPTDISLSFWSRSSTLENSTHHLPTAPHETWNGWVSSRIN